jgi:cytochrome bd ubiquinol oxidase subunit I
MNTLTLSQIQFAVTSIYHFFFVPLTLGLTVLVAIMETIYVRTAKDVYRKMTQFWGSLMLINFAMGVVTGIVQEFQFGMNWSAYSRFVGDIFGAPLAIEALLAFFLESTFLGVWIFGWERLSKRMHLTAIWLVAAGSNLSALWILIANSFMQNPVGYSLENGRAVMTNFGALLTNPNLWLQFPHVVTSGFTTAAFFVIGISAYHLQRKNQEDLFRRSLKIATIFGTIAVLGVIGIGHLQGQNTVKQQPMKMAAVEALWDSEKPAGLSLFTIIDEAAEMDTFSIRVPGVLSFLSFNNFEGEVKGIHQLQKDYVEKYGPGNYVPPITLLFWSFRIMVGAGFLMLFLVVFTLIKNLSPKFFPKLDLMKFLPFTIALPYIANTFGWIMTEMGRQPWVVFGLMKTSDAISPNLSAGMVLTSLIVFSLLYGILMIADVYLLVKFAKAGPLNESDTALNGAD